MSFALASELWSLSRPERRDMCDVSSDCQRPAYAEMR